MKKFLKKIIIGLLVFIAVNAIIMGVYEYPSYKAIQNKTHRNYLKWDAIHSPSNSFDMIIIGTSRCYAAFNPVVFDSILDTNSYNMSTSAQDIAETYYALEEIYQHQKPKYIVLDLFFETADESYDYYQIFSNSSFFKSNKRKFSLISDGYGSSGFLNYAIPLVRFKNYIKQDVSKLFSRKESLRVEDNWIKGHLHDTLIVSDSEISAFGPISNFENTSFSKERFDKYFNKINALVKKNNAKLICLRAPYPPTRLSLKDTDDEGTYFKEYTSKAQIPFFDINAKENYDEFYEDKDFADYHHTNYKGARKASLEAAKFIKQIIY
ncbi:MAG: hypothetical protein Wins2KO_03450 [Winogradskyella sp.]